MVDSRGQILCGLARTNFPFQVFWPCFYEYSAIVESAVDCMYGDANDAIPVLLTETKQVFSGGGNQAT